MRNKTTLGATTTLFALTLSLGLLQAEEINREFHETFDVSPGMLLKLKHGDGNVNVSPWDKDTLDEQISAAFDWRYESSIKRVSSARETMLSKVV